MSTYYEDLIDEKVQIYLDPAPLIFYCKLMQRQNPLIEINLAFQSLLKHQSQSDFSFPDLFDPNLDLKADEYNTEFKNLLAKYYTIESCYWNRELFRSESMMV